MTFNDFGLRTSTLNSLTKLGYTTPTDIQSKAIPALLAGDIDFIGQAQTGTGKTAAFLLPLLEKIDRSAKKVQALILAPTRELANQIEGELVKFCSHEKVSSLAVYGGTPIGPQLRTLRTAHPSVVVGTPGRVIDLIDRGALQLADVRYVVLDEADEMLDMGFFDDVQRIIAEAPHKKVWMFSATLPAPIQNLVKSHFKDPLVVKVGNQQLTTSAVEQTFLVARPSDMVEALCRYLDAIDDVYGLVFTRTKIGAQQLADALNTRGYPTEALHGDMEQDARDFTMKRFKEKKCKLVACTDVAARGIDVSDLTHVINVELPMDLEAYVHRIGRTGRANAKGVALSIISPMEFRKLGLIERITKAPIKRVELPRIEEIRGRLIRKSVKSLESLVEGIRADSHPEFSEFMTATENMSKEDLQKVLYARLLAPTMKKYREAREITVAPRSSTGPARVGGGGRDMNQGPARGEGQRLFVNVGRMDGANPGDLLKFLHWAAGLKGSEVGRIDVRDKCSFFEVSSREAQRLVGIKGKTWGQRRVMINIADGLAPEPASRARRPNPTH